MKRITTWIFLFTPCLLSRVGEEAGGEGCLSIYSNLHNETRPAAYGYTS